MPTDDEPAAAGGTPISEPDGVEHPELRQLALQAAWVAKLEAALGVLDDLLAAHEGGGGDAAGAPGEDDPNPLGVAYAVVLAAFEEADQALEAALIEWLGRDPEHWPIFRLVVLDPWSTGPGRVRDEAPGWVRSIATNGTIAHYQQDPYGRRRTVDLQGPTGPEPDDR